MNILFVNYHDFRSNSATHIFNLAEGLRAFGVSSAVAVPSSPESVAMIGLHTFAAIAFSDARQGYYSFPDGGAPHLVHAWTPREVVRRLTAELAAHHSIPYLVHLEDNEDVIAADQSGIGREQLLELADEDLDSRLAQSVSHPRRARRFLAGAAGVTVVKDRLWEFVPRYVPAEVIRPAFEAALFRPRPPSQALRCALGIGGSNHVVVYAGNVHPTNAEEVRSLYLAIALLNQRSVPVKLVRLGQDYVDFKTDLRQFVEPHVADVPFRPRDEVPLYYALADAFVQPGRPGDFNDYRVPSKLPEFFAMGRPVVLPATNVGAVANDGEECLHLREGDAADIASKLERIFRDEELRRRLGAGARSFAERQFSWQASAQRLYAFYCSTLRQHRPNSAPPEGWC